MFSPKTPTSCPSEGGAHSVELFHSMMQGGWQTRIMQKQSRSAPFPVSLSFLPSAQGFDTAGRGREGLPREFS